MNSQHFFWRTCAVVIACASTAGAQADDNKRQRPLRNYVLERQQTYQVQGTPTQRLLIGKRQIDIYSNGQAFERNHMVGQTK